MTPPVRRPHVAGSFYPAKPEELENLVASYLEPHTPPIRARAVVLPHAGYVYSGKTAGEVIRRVEIPDVCFLIGPNHWGKGEPFAIFPEGIWQTPLGPVPIDQDFASGLLAASHDVVPDHQAHAEEHSLEVEVPFLRFRNPGVKIVPLVVGTLDVGRAREVALSWVPFLKSEPRFLIVASTDMNHYENDELTKKKDRYALEAIEALDEEALQRAVEQHRITMCGYVPVYMTILLTKAMGSKKATLVDYRTSADASGDASRVVGYAGFIINE